MTRPSRVPALSLDELRTRTQIELMELRLIYKEYTTEIEAALTAHNDGRHPVSEAEVGGMNGALRRYRAALGQIKDLSKILHLARCESDSHVGELWRAASAAVEAYCDHSMSDDAFEQVMDRLEHAVAAVPTPMKDRVPS